MVTFCVIHKFSDKHKKDCKVRYFRLRAVKKDADTKTLKILKERRQVWLTKITRSSDNLSKAQLLEVNSTTRICGKHFLIVGAVMSMSNFRSIKLTVPLFSEQYLTRTLYPSFQVWQLVSHLGSAKFWIFTQ